MNIFFFQTIFISLALFVSFSFAQSVDTVTIRAKSNTSPVIYEANDPAIWLHPSDPVKSLIVGTDKGAYPNGGLFVWNIDGTQQQHILISAPNNVDIGYGMKLGDETIDIAVVTMRDHRQIRIFKIDSQSRRLSDISTPGYIGIFDSPYRLTLYKRPKDDVLFAIVSSANEELQGKLWQIMLEDDGAGKVQGTKVREFGKRFGVVEGMVADDEMGYIYAADDSFGIHKYFADPEQGNDKSLAFFANEDEIHGNRKGLALYAYSDRTGYILVSTPADRAIRVYRREGEKDNPNIHALVTIIQSTDSAAGDGIDVNNRFVSDEFPQGLLVWHNNEKQRFDLYSWKDIPQDAFEIFCNPSPLIGD